MTPSRTTPFDDPRRRLEAGTLGMWVFLVVLAVFFASAMIAFVVVRLDVGSTSDWSRHGDPRLPTILLASTAGLAASSLSMWLAQRRVARGASPRRDLAATLVLGAGFLVLQGLAWRELWTRGLLPTTDLYGWTFYVLTGMHAAHLLGGLIALGWVLGRPEPAVPELRVGGVRLAGMYWHFLGVGWIAFYGLLAWGQGAR